MDEESLLAIEQCASRLAGNVSNWAETACEERTAIVDWLRNEGAKFPGEWQDLIQDVFEIVAIYIENGAHLNPDMNKPYFSLPAPRPAEPST